MTSDRPRSRLKITVAALVLTMQRPLADEYAPFFHGYIQRVPDGPIARTLERHLEQQSRLFATLDDTRAAHRYAPDKWSVRQIIGHLADGERVMAYRALTIARGDTTPLPPFEEDLWTANANADRLPTWKLAEDWRRVRLATLSLLDGFDEAAWTRRGTVNANTTSARALAWIIAGHELHHLTVLAERYGIST